MNPCGCAVSDPSQSTPMPLAGRWCGLNSEADNMHADQPDALYEPVAEVNNKLTESDSGISDFFASYMQYAGVGVSEPPAIFHRWTCASIIGALLGRQAYLPFGHSSIFPNQFIMFMGAPGTRKSTAINIGKKLLSAAGYSRYAADKTSKERFLMDMRQYDENSMLDAADLEMLTLDEPAEIYVVAEEFTDFVGNNNMEFITMLTKLWDCPAEYINPKIHGASVTVDEPTVNILGGNTVQGFALAFPAEALGNGFLSRLIFVHGDTSGRKVTFPAVPDPIIIAQLAQHLKDIKEVVKGEFTLGVEERALCERLYVEYTDVDDVRFKHYGSRRFTHLLKLSMILAASDLTMTITITHLLRANTMLAYAERHMPKALGEFGKSKYSDVSNQILDHLNKATKPVNINALWKVVAKDLTKLSELGDIVKNLIGADKIQQLNIAGVQGFLPKHVQGAEWKSELLMPEWLTNEERM